MGSKMQLQQIISIIHDVQTWFVSPESTTQSDMVTPPMEKSCVMPPAITGNKVVL